MEHGHSIEDGIAHINQRQSLLSRFSQLLLKVWIMFFLIAITAGYSYLVSRDAKIFDKVIDFNNHHVPRLAISGIFLL